MIEMTRAGYLFRCPCVERPMCAMPYVLVVLQWDIVLDCVPEWVISGVPVLYVCVLMSAWYIS